MNQSCNCNHYTTVGAAACGCTGGCPQPCPCPAPEPECPPRVEPADVNCGCDCAPGLTAALQLLCDPRLSPLIDYTQFAFITRNFILGTSLCCCTLSAAGYDNLTGPLEASFVRFLPDSCERLEVAGQLYYPIPVCDDTACCAAGLPFPAEQISLCALTAVAFTVLTGATPEETADSYQQAKRVFWQATHGGCVSGAETALPTRPTPCDAAVGGISGRRSAALAAGPLLIANAAVLGNIGSVLILANDSQNRFYFVCENEADIIG